MSEMLKLLSKVRIHPTMWAVAAIAVATAQFSGILLLFAIVFIHEMGHAAAAHYYKWRIKSITILPFGGSMETEEYGNRPMKEEAAVILLGPIQHLWLAGVFFLLYNTSFISYEMYRQFFHVNAVIMIFNLLPVWPLDGGKLLLCGLSSRFSFLAAHRFVLQISAAGMGAGLLYLVLTNPLNIHGWLIAGFIGLSLLTEWRQRYYAFIRFLLERHYGRGGTPGELKPIRVDEDISIMQVLEQFQRGCKHPVIVMKDGRESGSLDENEILHAYFSQKLTGAKIGELLYSY